MQTEMKIEYTFDELMNIVAGMNEIEQGQYNMKLQIKNQGKKDETYIFEFVKLKEDKKNSKAK